MYLNLISKSSTYIPSNLQNSYLFANWPENILLSKLLFFRNVTKYRIAQFFMCNSIFFQFHTTTIFFSNISSSPKLKHWVTKREFLIFYHLNRLLDLALLCLDRLLDYSKFNHLNRNRLNRRSRQGCTKSNRILD